MLLAAFLKWWYGPGWARQVHDLENRVKIIGGMFSVGILLRTMFAPWKQIVSYARRDMSLADKVKAEIDNVVSRFVGFGVRTVVLFTALIGMASVSVVGCVGIILWPFMPLLPALLVGVTVWAVL